MKPMSTAPKAQILALAEMAAYQDGSVVSRQITKAEAGNVTLFAFDAGQALSEHTAPFDALVQVLDGEAEGTIAGTAPRGATAARGGGAGRDVASRATAARAAPGRAVLRPANQPHAVSAPVRFKMLLTMIRSA